MRILVLTSGTTIKPGVQEAITIEDIMRLGCQGSDGYISENNLLPVANCKLNAQGEKFLAQSMAHSISNQSQEIHLILNGQEAIEARVGGAFAKLENVEVNQEEQSESIKILEEHVDSLAD